MYIDLCGQWNISLETNETVQAGVINLPGTLQGQGFGNQITRQTPWVSGLHDAFWYEQEEYKCAQEEEVLVPFLAQPPRHFLGKAYYEREFEIEYKEENMIQDWFLRIELTHWRSQVWIDDIYMGEDCSLCTAHEIPCGKLTKGKHVLKVCIDNSMQYPYRPDGHGVSDALGATWNGMAGEIVLETASHKRKREEARLEYAKQHPRRVEIKDNNFCIDGKPEYFRGTHFGGDYPLTGCPTTEMSWWLEKMEIVKEWGLNAIRCHSYCPPEAAFAAADEAGVYLLVECGMWNIFEEDIEMNEVLRRESRRILKQFGHHPSFAFFSPSNEPGGNWYQPLRRWVSEIRAYDKELGYGGRRVYTAESGWFYDVEPAQIAGTDFVYFHRSAYGPYHGGTIRNHLGWKGNDYSPSLKDVKQPVICHELGQWCVYPDFDVIDKFTGYMKPSNYMVYKEQARRQGLLYLNKTLTRCSGRNQFRLYKEELEANFRTPEIKGFELLDLHDYLGQGTALIGLLDPFWESKGYATPEEFRAFCGETVLLTRCSSYVWKNTRTAHIPVEICHFGKEDLRNVVLKWKLKAVKPDVTTGYTLSEDEYLYAEGTLDCPLAACGGNTSVGNIEIDFGGVKENTHMVLILSMENLENTWDLYVYTETSPAEAPREEAGGTTKVLYTKSWEEALKALKQGKNVVYSPYLTDMNFECPVLSIKNVYWNSQMGPTWGRNVGVVIEKDHPVFADFPTEESGGWQWEDILDNARGFDLRGMEGIEPILRPIDDWNRSLPLGMMLEAKVEKGNLFLVSADLEGEFEKRPVAYCLKQAILKYAGSDKFAPKQELLPKQIEKNLFPVTRMETLIMECKFEADTKVMREEELFNPNPNNSIRIEKADFPVIIEFALKKEIKTSGILYLPEQRDRAHEGFLQDYRVEYLNGEGKWTQIAKGTLKNTSLSQEIIFGENTSRYITAQNWRFIVESCYGCVDKEVWKDEHDGWRKVFRPKAAVLQMAGLHLICGEPSEHSDRIFWEKEQKSATKEIDN